MDISKDQTAGDIRINRFLPYWAVFQADVRQTLRSWTFRSWVLLSVLSAVAFLLYRYGAKEISGMIQPASELMTDLLKWMFLGSISLIVVLTGGTISSERGTMADSVLSRGISRYQFFVGKLHARLTVILGTFFLLGCGALAASRYLLNGEDLSIVGSLVAMLVVGTFLAVVITSGVSISALTNSTLMSIMILWITLYGGGFILAHLPPPYPSPERAVQSLPFIIQGQYDLQFVGKLMIGATGVSAVVSILGMQYFACRDV